MDVHFVRWLELWNCGLNVRMLGLVVAGIVTSPLCQSVLVRFGEERVNPKTDLGHKQYCFTLYLADPKLQIH